MAAATLVVLTFGLVYAVATAREAFVDRLRRGTPNVKRWGGGLLVVVGVWMLSLAVFADFFSRVFPV